MLQLNEISKIAYLARIKINPEEEIFFQKELQNILGYFQSLQKVNTTNVDITLHPITIKHHFREDILQKSFSRDDIFANSPTNHPEFFIVPKVMDN